MNPKYHCTRLIATCLLSAALWLPPPARAATAAEEAAVRTTYPQAQRDSERITTTARGLLQTGGPVILDAKSGSLVNPTGTSIPIRDDITLQAPSNGGNAGESNALIGVVQTDLIPIATFTDGTAAAKTKALMDDTPLAEFAALTLVGAQPTLTQDATTYKVGTKSLKLAFTAAAAAADGAQWTAFAGEDWTTEESVGFWVYSTANLTAGDVTFTIVDSTADYAFNFPAVTKNTWTWVEIDITVLATTNGDAVTNYKIKLSTDGAASLGAFDLYLDGAYKWDATEELALGVNLIDSPGAVRRVLAFQKAASGNADATALVPAALVEGTDYFVHTETGNDFLVTISDLSLKTGFALVYHK